MKRDELDAMIQHAMEKRTEHLHANPMMLERIKRKAASRERKERISMKLFTAKRIAAVAVVCFASVTCYAAVHFSGVEAQGRYSEEIYTVGGVRTETTKQGVNIIRKEDGTVVKVYKK